MNLKTRFITLTALGLLVLVAFSGALPAAHAQSSPSVAVSLSDASVEQGTAITATMSFTGLAFDSDTSTTDYTFRADVTGANDCEGGGLGKTRYMYRVDQDPEVRTGTISASCPAGDYTIRATISTPQSVALAAATASFTVAAPAQAPTASPTASSALSPSDAVGEGAEITATMSFGGLASDSDASTTDYVFRADVVDADDCEGGGLGQRPLHVQGGPGPGDPHRDHLRRLPCGSLHAAGQHIVCRQHGTGLGHRRLLHPRRPRTHRAAHPHRAQRQPRRPRRGRHPFPGL